jgi:hypothetical protein
VHAGEPRPQLDVGTDETHTSPELLAAARDAFGDLKTGVNESFHGTYVPLRFYDEGDTRVQSVMLEIRRDVYMDEDAVAKLTNDYDLLGQQLVQLATSM